MEWNKYNITLVRLTLDDIELVRNWRNDPKISQYMFYREYITPEMQLQWFNSINNDLNYYWIIKYNNEKIGLINLKDIDKEKKCGEGGLFIYTDDYRNSIIPCYAAFCHHDFIFDELGLDFVYGRILPDNKRAVNFNKMLGAEITLSDDGTYSSLIITKENYYKQRKKYLKILF